MLTRALSASLPFPRDAQPDSVNHAVRRYAAFIAALNVAEALAWAVGIYLPNESPWRPWSFLVSVAVRRGAPGGGCPASVGGRGAHPLPSQHRWGFCSI